MRAEIVFPPPRRRAEAQKLVAQARRQRYLIGLEGAGDGAGTGDMLQPLHLVGRHPPAPAADDDGLHPVLDQAEGMGDVGEGEVELGFLQRRHDALPASHLDGVQRLFVQPDQLSEIFAHRLQRERVFVARQHLPADLGELAKLRRRREILTRAKDEDLARLAPAFAVAAPGGLGDGVDPRRLAPDAGEIHIHPRLDQRGGHKAHRLPRFQPRPHRAQHRVAMGGRHPCGEHRAPLGAFEPIKKGAGMGAAVDDGERLHALPERAGQRFVVDLAGILHPHPAEGLVEAGRVGSKLGDFGRLQPLGGREAVALRPLLQRRLGGGAEHHRSAIAPRQFLQCRKAGAQQVQRQHLRLVEDDDRAGQPVQLAAFRWPIGEEAFEELHCGCHDHRPIPVLRRKAQALGFGLVREPVPVEAGVMLQHCVGVFQRRAKHRRRLLDDRDIRDHVDHPLEPVGDGVIEREGERGQRLAAAGGHGQREQAGFVAGLGAHMGEDAGALGVDAALLGRAEGGQMRVKRLAQLLKRAVPAARALPPLDAGVEGFGFEEIRVHQRREQHPGKEMQAEIGEIVRGQALKERRKAVDARQVDPLGQVEKGGVLQALAQGCRRAARGSPDPPDPVGQPCMVAGDGIGEELADSGHAELLDRIPRPLAAVGLGAALALQIGLKGGLRLAQIVQQPRNTSERAGSERLGKGRGPVCNRIQVIA